MRTGCERTAEAAAEAAGARRIAPYWRMRRVGGELNPKYPGGIEPQRGRLEAEGHQVPAKGRKWVVADHERRLARG